MNLDEEQRKQLGAIPKNSDSSISVNTLNTNNNSYDQVDYVEKIATLAAQIRNGYKVLIILRGAPGSGKSTLARNLIEANMPSSIYSTQHFILSTDDYFYDSSGRYRYDVQRLNDAHEYNQRRAREKTTAGWSPIIIDNTNMQLWEMMPYVEMGVKNGYIIELLEPQTSWRWAAGKLSLKNRHKVPSHKIQNMLNKYERGTANDLIKMLKQTKYTMSLPQLRKHPPTIVNTTIQQQQQATATHIEIAKQTEPETVESALSAAATVPHQPQQHTWKSLFPVEQQQAESVDKNAELHVKPTLLDLLKEGISEVQTPFADASTNEEEEPLQRSKSTFQRHCTNCRNELPSFVSLRQIYPNKSVANLWDLFEKCSGDINWAIDLLLKEDELAIGSKEATAALSNNIEERDEFVCDCDSQSSRLDGKDDVTPIQYMTAASLSDAKPQRQNQRTARQQQQQQTREFFNIEYVFNDQRGSGAKVLRNGNKTTRLGFTSDAAVQTDNDDDDSDPVDELIEVRLGHALVRELSSAFKVETESRLDQQLSEELNTNVFLPRALARELYMLWMESAYNQLEEQRQKTLRDDEEFARLLKIPKYEHFTQSPANTTQLLDEEMAWALHREERERQQPATSLASRDLATHLKEMKLSEVFPHIPRATLLDILVANDNNYSDTLNMLHGTVATADMEADQENGDNAGLLMESTSTATTADRTLQPAVPLEEAKRLALVDFEEMRNMAAHHCQLKAECYQKAKDAIRKGNGEVALYYSQVAEYHKQKINYYNHRAANSIVEVHKRTKNNPELLDLHYLHVVEAICCLDLFLDGHIAEMRSLSRPYKHIFIITGRGLHSVGGISTIKNKVKSRLKERNLRWSEVNPGLLKVKIFSASRHSKNV